MTPLGTSQIAGARGQTGGRRFPPIDPSAGARLEPEIHEASDYEAWRAMDAAGESRWSRDQRDYADER